MSPAAGYGPAGCPRAIVLTFDNLGEASALERGTWSGQEPLGEDPSVTRALPRLLDALDAGGLTATFFTEAVNCELNPLALRTIAGRGHELGVHGWRHEPWFDLGPDIESELLARATAAFTAIGLPAAGFRPPGGALTPRSATLLRALGYRWYSAADDGQPGADPTAADGLASVPFSWDLVDAYHLMDRFAGLRTARGDAAASASPAAVAQRLAAALGEATGGLQTVVLHPFLMLDDGWWAGVRDLLALMARLSRDGAAWVAGGADFAAWLSQR